MADALFSFLKLIQPIKKMMLRLRWESIDQVKNIKTPIFFISGDQDTLVPTEMTFRLTAATTNAEFKDTWIVPGGLHNNTFMVAGPLYFIKVRQFMDKCKSLSMTKGLGKTEPQEAAKGEAPLLSSEVEEKKEQANAPKQSLTEVDILDGLGSKVEPKTDENKEDQE